MQSRGDQRAAVIPSASPGLTSLTDCLASRIDRKPEAALRSESIATNAAPTDELDVEPSLGKVLNKAVSAFALRRGAVELVLSKLRPFHA